MKLATMPDGSRDGTLVVVSKDLARAAPAKQIAPTLQNALENWDKVSTPLAALAQELETGKANGAMAFNQGVVLAPLPRAYQWLDGSVFKSHLYLMARAFNNDPEPHMKSTVPLMYQGGSDNMLGARQDVILPTEEDGIDFEAEVGIITGDVPMGTKAADAAPYIRLVLLVNDVSLRRLAPIEMNRGFGWIQAKPSSAFSPVAVTPDELGPIWHGGKVNLPIRVSWNGERFGEPDASYMSFTFYDLIEYAAMSRPLSAGTIIGSGTISNENAATVGSACIAERRALEIIADGQPKTNFMRFGDKVKIDMLDKEGTSIFGAIDQTIKKLQR